MRQASLSLLSVLLRREAGDSKLSIVDRKLFFLLLYVVVLV